ncbi:MAG: phenylalanine--tRNA ligase subunit beta, partial [Bacteroidales bacterium]|nr:phenylalanine--tRNA ligase subunit beta [Bacteroidales bacterium]
MNISYNWLKEYINTDKTANELAEILTSLGLEVGSIEEIESIKGGLAGVVVGEVLSCQKHPGADKLSITTVNIGGTEPLPIVCGAPNVAAGQKVLVATVGTTLYSGDEPFVIKKAKIRGEVSEGMICAEDELGIGTDHEGIMALPADTPVGLPAAEYFKIENDTLLELDLTPNRIDAASHLGVARDLAAHAAAHGSSVQLKWPSVDSFKVDNQSYPVNITLEKEEACTRYSGLTISGVKVKESPDWLKNKLRSIGMTPINNIVDITNFVLHECGQPLHAFDGDQISGNQVIVKTSPAGTKFITLDGKERELHSEDLMICNKEEGMCIAGVFGGAKSGVSQSTTRIFLESACFNPVYIRRTSRRHGLFTDASFRYERGSDPDMVIYALKRAALLIKELAGGEISSDIQDIYPKPQNGTEIELSKKNLARLIGKELDPVLVKTILKALDIKILNENREGLSLLSPPYRVDVLREADVIEEILRVYGYNNVEISGRLNSSIVISPRPDHHKLRNIISAQLIGAGFQEIMCNSLTKAAYYENSEHFKASKTVMLTNPLSTDLNGLRQTLLFGGLETIIHNRNRKHPDLKLFELGNCYALKENADITVQKSYREEQKLAIFMTGAKAQPSWTSDTQDVSFADIKTHAENVLHRMGISSKAWHSEALQAAVLKEGLIYMLNNVRLMTLGIVSDRLLKKFDIDAPVFYAEIDWDNVVSLSAKHEV